MALLITPAQSQMGVPKPLEKDERIVSLVKETAIALCGSFQNSGRSTEFSVEGNAKAQVNGLLKKLSDIGVSVNGKLRETSYVGPLREDLAKYNKDVSTCNVQIFQDLLFLLKAGGVSAAPDSNFTQRILKSDDCGNKIFYYETLSEPNVFRPQSVWTCKFFEKRRVSAGRAGLSVDERLALDKNRAVISVASVDSLVRWGGISVPIFTIRVKNAGSTSVQIRSIDVLASYGVHNGHVDFFPKQFVIYPGDEILVPVAAFATLAKLVDAKYDEKEYTYTVSSNSSSVCKSDAEQDVDVLYSCTGQSFAFGVSVQFMDIFGDGYRSNTVAFVRKQKWETSSMPK